MSVRLLLGEPQRLVRAGLRLLLETLDGIDAVWEASTGREVLEMALERAPDVVLLNAQMPELNGIDASERIIRDVPDAKIIVLSRHSDLACVAPALEVGVNGYVTTDAEPAELAMAIQSVLRGGRYLSAKVSAVVLGDYHLLRAKQQYKDATLTRREREIVQLIAEGRTTKEIAAHLELSTKTVDAHRTAMMNRLQIHNIAGLVRYAIRERIVSGDV